MIKILSIGNSFSEDAQRWLQQMAASAGTEIKCVNLMIGGCSLERHCNNIATAAKEYRYQLNGQHATEQVSIYEGLLADDWDIVTVQQVSNFSGIPQSYIPYLTRLADFVRMVRPNARLYIQQTWSYDPAADHPAFAEYNNDHEEMYRRLCDAYKMASRLIDAPLIPSGDFVQYLRRNVPQFHPETGSQPLNRDGYHLSLLYGRYAAALMWYATLYGNNLKDISFIPEDGGECADPEILDILKTAAEEFLKK